MPSTLVHVAFGGLLAAALLQDSFDRRAVLVVMALTAFPDLDAFVSLYTTAGHRTAFHTYLLPGALGLGLWADTRLRSHRLVRRVTAIDGVSLVPEESFVRRRWGAWGVAVGWVSILSMAIAGIGLDFIEAGVNPLWPLHDQYYVLNGKMIVSDQRGFIQTFVDITPDTGGGSGGSDSGGLGPEKLGTSQEVNMSTGINPDPDNSEKNPERVFPIVRTGWQLHLLLVGFGVTMARLWREE